MAVSSVEVRATRPDGRWLVAIVAIDAIDRRLR